MSVAVYRVQFTPEEPYFLGDEKSALFTKDHRSGILPRPYFIRSLTVPTQTTLMGTLRYLLLPNKHADFSAYTPEEQEENNRAVGRESLDLARTDRQSFGQLQGISPLFMMHGDEIYVPTPKDHRSGVENRYDPIRPEEFTSVQTIEGEKWVTAAYSPKEGLTDSWMSVQDGTLVSAKDLFHPVEQTGINRSLNEGGFFRRQSVRLEQGWSFALYVTLSEEPKQCPKLVTMGQNKSIFHVDWERVAEDAPKQLEEDIIAHLLPGTAYCFGDTLADSTIYEQSRYSAVSLRQYRGFSTGQQGHIRKGECLYQLFGAGSLFRYRDQEMFWKEIDHPNRKQAGLNVILFGK